MERPRWATVIGVLAIIFGALGLLRGAQEMVMPSIMQMQKEIMSSIEQSKMHDEQGHKKSSEAKDSEGNHDIDVFNLVTKIQAEFRFPGWFKSWSIIFGLISMLVGALYLLSGIFLLMMKPLAINLFYAAVGISVAWSIIQIIVYSVSGSNILLMQVPMTIASIVIDIILLIVVLVGNKANFAKQQS